MGSANLYRLDKILQSQRSTNAAGLRPTLEKLYEELNDRADRSSTESRGMFIEAFEVLKRVRGTSCSDLRLKCLRSCWDYFFHHGNSLHALEVASHYADVAAKTGSASALRTSLNLKGIVLGELGDISEAVIHYCQALEIAREERDAESEALVLNNLGTALNYAGLYEEAIPCFEHVISKSQPTWKHQSGINALSNLAQSHYYLENFEEAFDAIEKCLTSTVALAGPIGLLQQTIREFMFVQIALELQYDAVARSHAVNCERYALLSNSRRCQLMAQIAAARCDVRQGKTNRGLRLLQTALEESWDLDSSHRDALIAIIKAYDEARIPESALEYMERLLEHIRQHRAVALSVLSQVPSAHARSKGTSKLVVFENQCANLRRQVAERQVITLQKEMLERLAMTADLKNDPSGEHGLRVGRLAAHLAKKIGLTDDSANDLDFAARLHDIGKIAIPDHISGSSTPLKQVEREFLNRHAAIGAEVLAHSKVKALSVAADIARHHHEWWNGQGYPDRLSGPRISMYARITAIADVFDRLIHDRSSSGASPLGSVLARIQALSGSQFDPDLTGPFLELTSDIQRAHGDVESFLASATADTPFCNARKRIRSLLDHAA